MSLFCVSREKKGGTVVKLKVLYVDDEADIREVATMSLELDPEIEVRACSSGQQALEEAACWHPAVILLDVMMPGMDGPGTLAALRSSSETNSIPVIFITARAQQSEIDGFIALGAIGVIPKPFDPMDLARRVRRLLNI